MMDKADEAPVRTIDGPTILLGSGSYFDFESPETSDITIEDIAWPLAFACRFAGQTVQNKNRVFYSVAEHSVRMSFAVPRYLAAAALMHDATEAVMGDMTSPLKSIMDNFRDLEHRIGKAFRAHFRIPMVDPVELRIWDMVMLATEKRDLMPDQVNEWPCLKGIKPLDPPISPWDSKRAATAFLARYEEHYGPGSYAKSMHERDVMDMVERPRSIA